MTGSTGAWDRAPVGLLTTGLDGTVLAVNQTLLDWTGRAERDLVGQVALSDLLSVGGRIYWETHLSPLLLVERRLDEVVLELVGPAGRMSVLLTAEVEAGSPGRVSVALSSARERVRYERELRAARAHAEVSGARVQALQSTTAALSGAVGVEAVAQALLASATGVLGAASASLWLPRAEGDLERGARLRLFRGAVPAGAAAGPVPAASSLRADAPVPAGDRVVVPLQGQGGPRGVLSLVPSRDAGADPLDLEVLAAIGQQAGLALDRAYSYQQSADVAHQLQQSLLQVDPPADPRFAVATAYRPGVEALEVGGDWYDVFLADEGVLAVVVGDVVGRGLVAASAMGQLRSAVRAVSGAGPARVLERLDRFVAQVEAASMATIAYCELDLATGTLRYACAGHPPPLLLGRGGAADLLWGGRSTPLGAFGWAAEREEATLQLVPGDRLLLYTDGLVERRDRGLDDGLELLRATSEQLSELPAADAVPALTDALLRDEQTRDDVCVLLLAWTGDDFERVLGADLTTLSQVRRDLRAWLVRERVPEEVASDVVLATSEAVANAAEHGCGRLPSGRVRLAVHAERGPDGPGAVVVTVRDGGRWREAPSSPERGRGLQIAGAVMDEVLVTTGDGTTVVLRRRLGLRNGSGAVVGALRGEP